MAFVTFLVLQSLNLQWIGKGEIQLFDRDWPLNRAWAWSLIIAFPAALVFIMRVLIGPLVLAAVS